MVPPPFMDFLQTTLHPCSLETIQTPIVLPDGHQVWPMMVSCYQLDEETDQRHGDLKLYLITVPDVASTQANSLPLSFGPSYHVLTKKVAGILHGQWLPLTSKEFAFATAHASGQIMLHSLQVAEFDHEIPLESDPLFYTKYLGESKPLYSEGSTYGLPPPLCLSLDWLQDPQLPNVNANHRETSRLVSSYSNGKVAIHDAVFLENGSVELILHDSWLAHSFFANAPAEVWSTCWLDTDTLASCGDDTALKLWDVRCTTRPIQVMRPFAAGATCVSRHPRQPYIFACGSYDETICLYDVRKVPQSLCQTAPLGGGIWRLKWHPYRDDRLLVGAMHGGCRILKVSGWGSIIKSSEIEQQPPVASIYNAFSLSSSSSMASSTTVRFSIKKEFVEHESMAYGADWLACPHPTQNGFFEAAASCSFYDRAVYLWDSVY